MLNIKHTINGNNGAEVCRALLAIVNDLPEQSHQIDDAYARISVMIPSLRWSSRILPCQESVNNLSAKIASNAKAFGGGKYPEKEKRVKAAYSAVSVRILRDLCKDKNMTDAAHHARMMGAESVRFYNQRNTPFFVGAIEPSGIHDGLIVGINSLNGMWCVMALKSGALLGKYYGSKNAAIQSAQYVIDRLPATTSLADVLAKQEQHDCAKAADEFDHFYLEESA